MPQKNTSEITIKPKANLLTWSYIIFSIPGFITGIFWMIITLFILFGVIFAANTDVSDPDSNDLELNTISESSSKDGVLVYNLNGAILTGDESANISSNGIFTKQVEKDFRKIKEDDNIKNVVFKMNTPGGTIFASEILGDLINDLVKSKGQSQAVFYYDQLVASGGLWSSNKVDDSIIYASPYGETGSIGVVLTLPNYSQLANKVGYSETVIKSSGSKDIGNPFRDPSQNEVDFLQSQVQDKYNEFIDIVAKGRDIERGKVVEIANGFVYSNQEAKEFKLVDELSSVDNAIKKAGENAGLEKYDVWEIKERSNPFQSFLLENALVKTITNTRKALDPFPLQSSVFYVIDENRIN